MNETYAATIVANIGSKNGKEEESVVLDTSRQVLRLEEPVVLDAEAVVGQHLVDSSVLHGFPIYTF